MFLNIFQRVAVSAGESLHGKVDASFHQSFSLYGAMEATMPEAQREDRTVTGARNASGSSERATLRSRVTKYH